MTRQLKTSWESSAHWYDEIVGSKGHYFHEHVILPQLMELMQLSEKENSKKILDLGCGQGILEKKIPKQIEYVGIDLSPTLIKKAKEKTRHTKHSFIVGDVSKSLPLPKENFSDTVIILALQNMENIQGVLKNAFVHLANGGQLFLVLNHPCFRIPRQSHWGIDESKKLQYRRVDSYLSPMKIPIQMHPGKKGGQTLSFHYSLSDLSLFLENAGFAITKIREWISDKKSTGSKARMENRARKEFPLFLTLVCKKVF